MPNLARPVSNDSVPRVDLENTNQEAHDVVTAAIRDDRASVDPTVVSCIRRKLDCDDETAAKRIRLNQSALNDSPSRLPPMDIQPRSSGSASSPSVSPHPTRRVATKIVPNESHTPSGIDELMELRKKCQYFRVLVLGRANAGKTTLLKAVCGATGDPEILDTRGRRIAVRKREETVGGGLAACSHLLQR
ncbi:hypothetical protein BOTBODRAFT_177272 [Botryobasidium botryosum FD-172 SS1]|uniref:G domain-containing protein n=1 Tax=Botryobasidium botryosum (strain FD-172 SS1) TaxID=930990 RepID=A0A067M6P6_BOTB1|nr:hypothetical protein BOTBODRAFT_177272 [Botryobasidium botryosum FD-172 SS1]